jgi:hypothetical protein
LGSKIQIKIEDTMSKTGKHRRISKVFVASRNGAIMIPKLLNSWNCSGIYKKGRSVCGYTDIEENHYLISIELTLNWRHNAKGYVNIIDFNNSKVLTVKYVNGKLRYVSGDKTLLNLAKASLDMVVGEALWKDKELQK